MTLGFSHKINGKAMHFPEKIIHCLTESKIISAKDYYPHCLTFWHIKHHTKDLEVAPKLHTIREDKHDRWRAGMDIHFVVDNRSSKRLQFAPIVKCTGVQRISILPKDNECEDDVNQVLIEGVNGGVIHLSGERVIQLAINDGFDCVEDFWEYFKEPFDGKLIHWTDLRY